MCLLLSAPIFPLPSALCTIKYKFQRLGRLSRTEQPCDTSCLVGGSEMRGAQLLLWTELSCRGIFRELLGGNYEVLPLVYNIYVYGLHQPHIYVSLRPWRIRLSVLPWGGETDDFQGCLSLGVRAGGTESSRERREQRVAHWGRLSLSSDGRGAGTDGS